MKKSSFGKTNEVETYRKYNETPLHWVSTVKLPIQFICKIRVLDMNKLYIELYNFILWMFPSLQHTQTSVSMSIKMQLREMLLWLILNTIRGQSHLFLKQMGNNIP